jgi:hypothetical protein
MTTEITPDIGAESKPGSIWLRGLFMLLFVLIYGVAELVILAVALTQFGWLLATEEINERLQHFGASLSEFAFEVMRFWTFVTEEKPFPFSPWPEAKIESESR